MTSTAYFFCPDDDRPFGGIRVIYRFVDILNSQGFKAAVAHRSAGFRCTWFTNRTRIVGAQDIQLEKGDVLVYPERFRELIPQLAPGVANIILNQNAYETFTHLPFNEGSSPAITSEDTIGIVCVSEDNHRYLELSFPQVKIERVRISIDGNLFQAKSLGKGRSIAYMPRKRLKELNEVLQILERRGSLTGWGLIPIQGMSESETAAALSGAAVFLALNEREGLGLPSLEAMASGCVVVGFHGGVGLEYMRPGTAIAIDDGDVIEMVHQVESVLSRWGGDDELAAIAENAANLVRREYSPEVEIADVVKVFGGALENLKDVHPGSHTVNARLLPKRGALVSLGEQLLAKVQTRRPGLS